MIKTLAILSLLIWSSLGLTPGMGQDLQQTTFQDLEEMMRREPRPVLVFLYTDWCKFCASMKNSTFKDNEVISKLNDRFYFVSFNGESKEKVDFLGAQFEYRSTGKNTGVHQLAQELGSMNGQLTYPVSVILNSDYEIVFQHNAFLRPDQLLEVLTAVSAD